MGQPADDTRQAGEPAGNGAPDAPQGDAWFRTLFMVRAVVVAIFAIAIAAIPTLGDDRFWVAAAVALVVPYNLAGIRISRRFGQMPLAYPLLDQFAAAGAAMAIEELFTPALLVMISSLALAASIHHLSRVIPVLASAIVASAVLSFVTLDRWDSVIALVGFAGAATLTVFPTALAAASRRELESENRDLVENMDAIVWWLDEGHDDYGSMSASAGRILGFPMVQLTRVSFWLDHVHDDDRDRVALQRAQALRTGDPIETDYRMRDGSGRLRWMRDVVVPELHGGERTRLRGFTIDITARRSIEEERQLYHEVVAHIDTAILVARVERASDESLSVIAANPAAAQLFGHRPGAMVGAKLHELLGAADASLLQRTRATASGSEGFTIERIEGLGIDRQKTFSVQGFGLPGGAVGLAIEDVTGAAMVAAALRRQALHDGLTGLPNRTLLRDRLRYALADAKRRRERVALILLDLNHFKEVNDALGHQYGDLLLTAFAGRLQSLLRECDTIARLGGDEFALLLTHATNEGASRVVTKVVEAMQEPFDLDGVSVQTTASLGVALYPDHAEDGDLLTQRADVAMYAAKRGGGGWSVYSPAHDQSSIERLTLLSDLHHELDDLRVESMSLHFQPQLDIQTECIIGAEALLRWEHPNLGWLNPEMVVELAELSGLIGQLAKFVAREAMTAASTWHARGRPLTVAVNLSARNLYDRRLTTWLPQILEETGLPPSALKCELTESEVMDDPVLAMDVISQLRDLGIRTAIDDFGTGYSSLAYLRRLPVDEIKIDKSFVLNMLEDANDRMIVRTVIDLAHNLGMSVVAEGVENATTLEQLKAFGCERAQGYHIGQPMTGDELLETVTSWERAAG